MTDLNPPPDISKKQCPNCYRLCDIHAVTCVACGADLTEDASVIAPHARVQEKPVPREGFLSFLGEVLSVPWRPFTRMQSGALPPGQAASALIFYVASLLLLALAAVLREHIDAPGFMAVAGANLTVVASIVQVFLLAVIIVICSNIFGEQAAFVAVFSMVAFFLGVLNVLEPVKIPLSFVPAFGNALETSFTWLFRIWFALMLFLFTWKALRWHPIPALGSVFFVGLVQFFAAFLSNSVATYLDGLRRMYEARGAP
ncbi:MAG: hypothetical protein V2A58_12340 [Planctomycetota bacterium]